MGGERKGPGDVVSLLDIKRLREESIKVGEKASGGTAPEEELKKENE